MIPKTVRIGGKQFPVTLQTPKEMDKYAGRILYDHQEIRISDNQCEDSRRETMLHEILHAASDLTGGDIPEREIVGLSKSLFGILRDNPALVAWLLEEGDGQR